MDLRDLVLRFLDLSPMNFMNYFKPSFAKRTRTHLLFKKNVNGDRLAFVYKKNVKLFYFNESLVMSWPNKEDSDKLAA